MKEIQRRQVYVLVYLFLMVCIGNVRGENEMCRADKILTGKDDEVDWWFITKVKGFGDVYLYVDSNMDNTATFKTGYYLRSVYSALGSTLSPFTGEGVNNKKNFISFCDHAAFNQPSSDPKKEPVFNKLYVEGAHQKGIIGWTEVSDTQWKGFYIDHTLPYFPQIHSKTFMNSPINFDPEKITTPRTEMKLYLTSMYFSYYGWRKPFFGRNLMPYDSNGGCVKDYLLKHDQDNSAPPIKLREHFINPHEKETKENERITHNERTGSGAFLKMDDIFPFAIIHTHKQKPSQHIFCISIDTKDKFLDFFKHYQYISNEGIVSNIHKVSDSSLSNIKSYISLYDEKGEHKQPTKVARTTGFKNQKLSFVKGITAESTINVNLGPAIGNDVWKGLIANQASKAEPYLENEAKIFISTWSDGDKEVWWRKNNQIKEPVFIADIYNSKIKWKSNTHDEHSKVAFTESQDHKLWNVCISGGNLYGHSKTDPIKSSIILCLKLDALHSALTKLKVRTWDGTTSLAEETEYDAYQKAFGDLKKSVMKMDEDKYVEFIGSNNVDITKAPGYKDPLASELTISIIKSKRLCKKLLDQSSETPSFKYSQPNDQGLINQVATANLHTIKFENSYTVKKPKIAGRHQDPDGDRLVQLGAKEETFMDLFNTLIPPDASKEYQLQLYT
ncbi:hypothetical protein CYY_004557 [Polysphondylium violaceum]|uniref:Uncharacterized protein n=1 Tax=Polysphondylium violaceum TaxID=133409 RepID=A0A8J4UZ61_9MYCE|nr:hypothetical protein CYY_004557 [Polysphondylium violaceum]